MLYTVVDIETNGFDRIFNDILSFGYLRCDNHMNVIQTGTLYFYKDSYDFTSKEAKSAFEFHGLTKEFLQQYRNDFYANLTKMYALLYNGNVVGKNLDAFDVPFIKRFIEKNARLLEPLELRLTYDVQKHYGPFYRRDQGITTRNKGTLTDYVLNEFKTDEHIHNKCIEYTGADIKGAHDAMYDVVATFEMFKASLKREGYKV